MPIHIMGGGPSAQNAKHRHPMIVVNKDVSRYMDAEYFVTCDIAFSRNFRYLLSDFKGFKIFATDISERRIELKDLTQFDLIIRASCTPDEFGQDFFHFATGLNSGFSAVQFAIIMGYKEIHLYGIDLTMNDKSHWHEGYGHPKSFLQERLDKFYGKFKSAINKTEGIRFISHSPISRLNELAKVEVS